MSAEVLIVPTGGANVASVIAGMERIGASARIDATPERVAAAERVVLPGVGAFGAAMTELESTGLDAALRERIAADRPTLAICLGLQLLAEESDESPGVDGLGVFPGRVEPFPTDSRVPQMGLRVPQMGWNRIEAEDGTTLLRSGFFYFANSFRLTQVPDGWTAARAEYGGSFVAALERGSVLACQFHPELSGESGRALLERWLASATSRTSARGASC